MLGSIIGDVAGSRFEFENHLSKEFELLHENCEYTDDTVMTCAVTDALLATEGKAEGLRKAAVESMQRIGRQFPYCGFGGRFIGWIFEDDPRPINSLGNGAAMRIAPVSDFARTLEEARELSREVTCVSHDHPEGLKAAEAAAVAGFMAKAGCSMDQIRACMTERYYPEIAAMHVPDLMKNYRREIGDSRYREWAPYSVPQALVCFLESDSFEDAIRNCVAIGGDCDTTAAIAGGIAELYYGIPDELRRKVLTYLPRVLLEPLERYYGGETLYGGQKSE
ncbi:MAG: ADP-ribosylglycohydrolase family protein [Oscillospiraceae bacterium]|nr:ADP-ribosylglycohydrolase family protein [Oscillospiraceae bacterium]